MKRNTRYLRLRYAAGASLVLCFLTSFLCSYFPTAWIFINHPTGRHDFLPDSAELFFSFGTVVYLVLCVYCVFSILPAHRDKSIYDEISRPLTWAGFTGVPTLLLLGFNHPGFAIFFQLIQFGLALYIMTLVRKAVRWGDHPVYVFPFSLFFGWITLFFTFSFVSWAELHGRMFPDVFVLGFLAGFTLFLSLRLKNWTYPFVIAAGLITLSLLHQTFTPVGFMPLLFGILLLAWSVAYGIIRLISRQQRIERPEASNIEKFS